MAQVRKRWYQVDPAYPGGLVSLIGTQATAKPGDLLEVNLNSGEYTDIVNGSVSDHSNYVLREASLAQAVSDGILLGPIEGGAGEHVIVLSLASLSEGYSTSDVPGLVGDVSTVTFEVFTETTDEASEVVLEITYGSNTASLTVDGTETSASFDNSEVAVSDVLTVAVDSVAEAFTDGVGILRFTLD